MNPALLALHIASCYWAAHSGLSLWKSRRAHTLFLKNRKWLLERNLAGHKGKAAIIIPTKGISSNFDRFFEFITTQDYGHYRIIFVTESIEDPAHLALRKKLQSGGSEKEITLLVAGHTVDCAQKVHNQLSAMESLREDDELIVFADDDLYGKPDWLTNLVLPINSGTSDLTTGHRWFIPENSKLPNLIIGSLGIAMESWITAGWRTVLWGGSMAMSRTAYLDLNVREQLARCLNDDVRITQIALQGGKRLRYVRAVEGFTPCDFTHNSLYEFGRRQYLHLATYLPKIALLNALFALLYIASFLTSILLLASGSFWSLLPVFAGVAFNLLRCSSRARYIRDRFPPQEAEKLLPINAKSWWVDPFERLATLLVSTSALLGKEMVWGSLRYRIRGPRDIEISEKDI
ncbi:glycosyltransferase [Luteolibacter sp. AS25]|uniref:glycosyltransferase n=1 Tax=Luteolibacter sp. AS25 TaxID=3135776 RepID=UPI00398A6B9D